MLAPVIRMTAKALGDATLGVNAQLLALSLDSTVAGVTDTRPTPILSIKNQADHNIEVREADNESQFPLIVVCVKDDWAGPGQVWTSVQDASGTVSCVLVTRGGEAAKNFLNTDYYLRAMKKAVHAYLLTPSTRDTNGRRNNVALKVSPTMTYGHAAGSFMGGEVAGVLKINYDIRDLLP